VVVVAMGIVDRLHSQAEVVLLLVVEEHSSNSLGSTEVRLQL